MTFLLALLTSFLLTLCLTPIFIKIVTSVDVLDQPNRRKIHKISTPSLGGIPIYAGLIFALLIAIPFSSFLSEKYFLGATFLIFILGIRDDVSVMKVSTKLLIQIFAAAWVVFFLDMKISGLHGIFGIHTFGWYFDELFTITLLVILTNSFNLIDGIDGLAGTTGIWITSCFAVLFYLTGDLFSTLLSLSIAGSLLAFLIYNWSPSKIFMGDTGSLTLGFILSVLMVRGLSGGALTGISDAPVALTMALFVLPIYDTVRVFVIRLMIGRHPFSPDRNHIHHALLRLGYTHAQATIRLVSYNILAVVLVYTGSGLGDLWLIAMLVTMTGLMGLWIDLRIRKKKQPKATMMLPRNIRLTKSA